MSSLAAKLETIRRPIEAVQALVDWLEVGGHREAAQDLRLECFAYPLKAAKFIWIELALQGEYERGIQVGHDAAEEELEKEMAVARDNAYEEGREYGYWEAQRDAAEESAA